MATLRYINNSRTGEPGTLVELDSPLQFYDDDSYIVATAAGALKIVGGTSLTLESTTITFNGAIALSGTDSIALGTSGSPLTLTASSPIFTLYSTTSNASTTNAEPFYVKSTLTGVGGYGGRSRFHTYSNVASGSNLMGLKSMLEFGDSGTGNGLSAGFCSELVMPNADTTSEGGAYCVLELEYVAGGSSLVTAGNLAVNHASFIRATNSGDADGDFDDNGFFFVLSGLNDATGHLLYNNTLKVGVGTTTWYMPLSSAQGSFTTAYPIVTSYATTALTIGACVTGIQLTNVSGYALQVITDGRVLLGTTSVGLPLATSEHGLAVHCEPAAAFTAYTSSFGIRSRYHVSVAQTNIVTYEAVDARLRVKASMAGGVHAGVQGYIEISDSPTLTTGMTQAGGFTVEAGAGTVLTSGYLYGVHIDSATADSVDVSNVSYTALRISTGTSSKEAWTYGIYIGDADAVTGLHIGTCTTAGIQCNAKIITGANDTGYDVKFFGATSGCYWLWDESADEVVIAGRINFLEDAARTGEGAHLFANGLSIGMATPGDCQGVKMEFDYGVSPTLTGGGKGVHGLDIKMTMDQEWNFSSADRNATVRGARIQGWSQDDVGGRVMGIYSNARAEGTSKTVEGIIGGTDDGPGIISLEARTELGTSATITTPAIVGLLIFHNSKTGSSLTGDYRAIQIQQPLMPTITGTKYGIYFGDDNNTGYPYDYAFGFSSELDSDQVAHTGTNLTQSGQIDGWIKVEIDGNPLYINCHDAAPA